MTDTMTRVPTPRSPELTHLERTARLIALEGFRPSYGSHSFRKDRVWRAFRDLGTMLWLDTGDLAAAKQVWTSEFTHLTTNKTLVKREAQSGRMDDLIRRAADLLFTADPAIEPDQLIFEIGFILNCHVALRLVEELDGYVSLDLHPALAHDVEGTIRLARRYYSVCPERFIVKIPVTPAGYLAVRRLSGEGIPVDFTLGFSHRQNYLAAVLSRPRYVKIFLSRLQAFLAENRLGDGKGVGEKVANSTQLTLWRLRDLAIGEGSRLIVASIHEPQQLFALAGIDAFTVPPDVAAAAHDQFLQTRVRLGCFAQRQKFDLKLAPGVKPEDVGLPALWDLPESFTRLAGRIRDNEPALAAPDPFLEFLKSQDAPNLFRKWSSEELQQIREDGIIPKYDRWKSLLASGELGLDDLMTTSALQSLLQDQHDLDTRIRTVIAD